MNSQPKSIEQKFLEAIALNYGFVGDTLAAFLMRFSQENAAKQNSTLVSFIAWNHQQFDSAQKLQDELARICEILKEDGCPIKQKGRGRAPRGQSPWEQVYRWIWEYRFPVWQQQNQQLVSEQGEPAKDKQDNFDELVREVRDRIRPLIQERCGTMRVLDMNQPIGLGEIYTHVNILEKITGRKRLKLADLVQDDVAPENFERFSLGAVKETMPGLEAVEKHSKLMILGKPGAGKTTFLKHLAIQCIGGAFQSDRVPLFITLKDFAEADDQPDLMAFIDQAIATSLSSHSTQQILVDGRALILLDGLDEVRETDASRILREIRQFSELYSRNAFVITCRIAAREHTFQQFTEVEVADFDDDQIAEVSGKWFRWKQDEVKAKRFLQQLKANPPIRDLASSPLLLTLLCLVFEDSGDFPANRAELYQTGVDVLLKKWDSKRNIERDQIYKKLSLKRKEDLLSQIAWRTFESGNYFFKQTDVERYIHEFIEHLPGASTDEDTLNLDSEVVLKSIEAQHGLFMERAYRIYSYSHLTFHEYFAAREAKEKGYVNLVAQHLTEKRWREVILLTVGMLPNADELLRQLKQQIDGLLAGDEKLQAFLHWVDEKAVTAVDCDQVPYKYVACRAFYTFQFALLYPLDKQLSYDCAMDIESCIHPDVERAYDEHMHEQIALWEEERMMEDMGRIHDPTWEPRTPAKHEPYVREITLNPYLYLDYQLPGWLEKTKDGEAAVHSLEQNCRFNLEFPPFAIDPQLHQKLQALCIQFKEYRDEDWDYWMQWWQDNGQVWVNEFRTAMIEHRNIGHDWQFSDAQREKLQQYYDANKLLMDCLNSDCYVSREVRQEIEDTLLLPIAEIEKRRKD